MSDEKLISATLAAEVYKKANITKKYLSGDNQRASVSTGDVDAEIDLIVDIYKKISAQLAGVNKT